MKQFYVWFLVNGNWEEAEDFPMKAKSRTSLSLILSKSHKKGTYKIRVNPE